MYTPPPNPHKADWLGSWPQEHRGSPPGYAMRTRKNLEFLELAFAQGSDVHVITQLVNSLLGVVVFPWEKNVLTKVYGLSLAELKSLGWPTWEINAGYSETLGQFLYMFRNSIAHGNVRFSSSSRVLAEVVIEVANFPKKSGGTLTWSARIRGDELREFVYRLLDLIESSPENAA